MIYCKSCDRESKRNYAGYCVTCYQYFHMHKNKVWSVPPYGYVGFVTDRFHHQFGQPICHICGKAYSKLIQHIHYVHKLSREKYCDLFGLDRSSQLTSEPYHNLMSNYAYENNMHKSLPVLGRNTRFKKGYASDYKRSAQTLRRLKQYNKGGNGWNI